MAEKSKYIGINICAMALAVCLTLCGCGGTNAGAPTPYGNGASADSSAGSDVMPQPDGTSAGDGAKAAGYITNSLAALDHTLYVYKDFADGANNFTQKAWIGDSYENIPGMNEATAGCDGTSGIAAELDLTKHLWGGYMFLNGSLAAGSSAPVPDFGKTDCGVDLTGAAKLVFRAKGETGRERVEFFMGGMGWNGSYPDAAFPDSTRTVTLGVVLLTTEWQEYEIDLSGVDLSNVGCGFGWVANDTNNPGMSAVKFSMDDIRYEFSADRQEPVFLQSYASAAPGTDEAIINNFAYLYDNAVAALALSYAGEDERARQIADAIVFALNHDRFYSDGRLRNAYSSGDPRSFPGWFSERGTEFARIPGFYDTGDGSWYEDYYAVSTSTGNLAWAMLALEECYGNAPEHADYLDAARRIGDFILTLKDERGGFTGGYEGWEPNAVKATYKSTEHNIDLISAYERLSALTGDQKYKDAAAWAESFVLSMYDAEKGVFYTGTENDGVTVNKDVVPLDSNTWAVLALGTDFTDGPAVMDFVERNMAVNSGYDFNDDKDGVWFEGTAQVALVYKQLGNTEKYEKILAYLNSRQLPDGSIPAADRDGVSTGFVVSGTDIPWKYGNRAHIGATAWLAFAQMGRNPFEAK